MVSLADYKTAMAKRQPEEIIARLRQVEVMIGQGTARRSGGCGWERCGSPGSEAPMSGKTLQSSAQGRIHAPHEVVEAPFLEDLYAHAVLDAVEEQPHRDCRRQIKDDDEGVQGDPLGQFRSHLAKLSHVRFAPGWKTVPGQSCRRHFEALRGGRLRFLLRKGS